MPSFKKKVEKGKYFWRGECFSRNICGSFWLNFSCSSSYYTELLLPTLLIPLNKIYISVVGNHLQITVKTKGKVNHLSAYPVSWCLWLFYTKLTQEIHSFYDLELGCECPLSNVALEYESDFLLNWFMLSFPNLSSKLQFSDSYFNCSSFNSAVSPWISCVQPLFETILVLAMSGIAIGCC